MIEVDYETIGEEIRTGALRERLEKELGAGFAEMQARGEPLPPASYYATKIAEIISNDAPETLSSDLAFDLYQEILAACEAARAAVLG